MMKNAPAYLKAWLDAIDGDEKFLMTLGAGIVNSFLLMMGVLDQSNYVILTTSTVGMYIAGKVIEDRSKVPPSVDP